MSSPKKKASEFLKVSSEFQLGHLSTEKPNPKSNGLSQISKDDLSSAVNILKNIDSGVLLELQKNENDLSLLLEEIQDTFKHEGRVFLCGCGATGRLSLTLETLWRQENGAENEQVIGFMAGGDVALIQSIEKFEDFPEYGEKQLLELGFGENDLLISCTEGGETPFVIGATEKASELSKRRPWFLYCNPDELLTSVERTNKVFDNKKIIKLNLEHGPQALAGSTRMQASTVLMYAVGLAIFSKDKKEISSRLSVFLKLHQAVDLLQINNFIEFESLAYENNEGVYYSPSAELGITVLTDTTERAPTFSLAAFENQDSEHHLLVNPSWSYLYFPNSVNSHDAWTKLLLRKPRGLEWKESIERTGIHRIWGFDFSAGLLERREKYHKVVHHQFNINYANNCLTGCLGEHEFEFDLSSCEHSLERNIFLKMLLNIHSTLVMGRLDRYKSNIMTWVRPSNNKLIDRTIRYAQALLAEESIEVTYEELVEKLFEILPVFKKDSSLVLELVKQFSK